MKTIHIDNYTIFFGENKSGKKFKTKLSKMIKAKFKETFDETNIKAVLNFCLDYYASEFESICRNETSYEFYRLMFWLHEQSVQLRMDEDALKKLNKEVGDEYFSIYRRVLKLILEEACLIDLVTEEINLSGKERAIKTFDNLMFLGEEMFLLANLLAEQSMIGDVVSIHFDDKKIYYLKRKREFELAFKHIVDMNAYKPNDFVTDKNAKGDFISAVKESFNTDYSSVMTLIHQSFEYQQLNKWDIVTIGFSEIEKGMKGIHNAPEEDTQSFLSGLYLKKANKIPVKIIVRKPYSIDRFLNRPFLIWKIDKKEYCVIGRYSTLEAINNLWLNAFPWNKAPIEWSSNQRFKKFLEKKERENEKMLIDAVEFKIKCANLIYQSNVKNLITNTGKVNLENSQCGEIDFLIINEQSKKIFIIECKHLIGRYDMANFYMDFKKFTKGEDCFNKKIEKKINWVKQNIAFVYEHFSMQKKIAHSVNDFTVEGFFIVNTPTFYMYYSDIRIYTYHEVVNVLNGNYTDKTYTLVIDNETSVETLFIKYPYFIKKRILYYEDPYADFPVDKYGHPIFPVN